MLCIIVKYGQVSNLAIIKDISIEEIFGVTLKGQNEFDKIFTEFSKFILGVHSKASNFKKLSELIKGPLTIWLT